MCRAQAHLSSNFGNTRIYHTSSIPQTVNQGFTVVSKSKLTPYFQRNLIDNVFMGTQLVYL